MSLPCPLRGHGKPSEHPEGTLTPWERSVATEAGFGDWEIEHCPAALIKDTYAFQATALGMALDACKAEVWRSVETVGSAVLDSLVRWLPFKVKW